MKFAMQDDVLAWLRRNGVRISYDPLSGRYSFPSNDLYELLKGLQGLSAEGAPVYDTTIQSIIRK